MSPKQDEPARSTLRARRFCPAPLAALLKRRAALTHSADNGLDACDGFVPRRLGDEGDEFACRAAGLLDRGDDGRLAVDDTAPTKSPEAAKLLARALCAGVPCIVRGPGREMSATPSRRR